eukprot:5272997-Pleurochrysis_carterae.AAC.1
MSILRSLNLDYKSKIQRRTIASTYNKNVSQLTAKDILDYFYRRFTDPSQKTLDEFMKQRRIRGSSSKDP